MRALRSAAALGLGLLLSSSVPATAGIGPPECAPGLGGELHATRIILSVGQRRIDGVRSWLDRWIRPVRLIRS